MTDKEKRYCDKVVTLIVENDFNLNVFIPKGTNRFIIKDYYVTKLFNYMMTDPLAFFTGVNWAQIKKRVRLKYALRTNSHTTYVRMGLETIITDMMVSDDFITMGRILR